MEIFLTIGGVILGGLITFFCSKYYYQKAAKELNKEAEKLRSLSNLILEGMEHAGLVTLSRDAKGKIIGFALKIHLSDTVGLADDISRTLSPTLKGGEENERR